MKAQNQMKMQISSTNLQNLDFFSDLAKGASEAGKVIGQVSDTYNQVAPVAGQVWGAVDPNSYNSYGKGYLDMGSQMS